MMGDVIEKFLEEQSWSYKKHINDDGRVYYSLGMILDEKPYHTIIEYDFEEKFLAVTSVHKKAINPKYSKKIMKIYNKLAQNPIPFTHLLIEKGFIASKYSYELLEENILSERRINHMIESTLLDIRYLYQYIKENLKKNKK